MLRHPLCAFLYVSFVLAFGANRRYTQKLAEFLQVLLAATFDKFSKDHGRPSGGMIRFPGIQTKTLNFKESCGRGSGKEAKRNRRRCFILRRARPWNKF